MLDLQLVQHAVYRRIGMTTYCASSLLASSTSALLFAEHCVRETAKEESDLLAIAYMDGRRQGQIDRLGGK